jgi:hypothetical protein
MTKNKKERIAFGCPLCFFIPCGEQKCQKRKKNRKNKNIFQKGLDKRV